MFKLFYNCVLNSLKLFTMCLETVTAEIELVNKSLEKFNKKSDLIRERTASLGDKKHTLRCEKKVLEYKLQEKLYLDEWNDIKKDLIVLNEKIRVIDAEIDLIKIQCGIDAAK